MIFICTLIVCIYAGVQVYLFIKNNFQMEQKFKIINLVLGLLIAVVGALVGLFSDKVSNYEGVSFSAMSILVMLWVFAIF